MPQLSEQLEIANVGQRMESRLRAEMAHLAALKELKSALLSILLTGELRVTLDTETV